MAWRAQITKLNNQIRQTGIEVAREEEMGVEHPGQSEERMVRWSQVLVDGRLVWMRTSLLRRGNNSEVVSEAG